MRGSRSRNSGGELHQVTNSLSECCYQRAASFALSVMLKMKVWCTL